MRYAQKHSWRWLTSVHIHQSSLTFNPKAPLRPGWDNPAAEDLGQRHCKRVTYAVAHNGSDEIKFHIRSNAAAVSQAWLTTLKWLHYRDKRQYSSNSAPWVLGRRRGRATDLVLFLDPLRGPNDLIKWGWRFFEPERGSLQRSQDRFLSSPACAWAWACGNRQNLICASTRGGRRRPLLAAPEPEWGITVEATLATEIAFWSVPRNPERPGWKFEGRPRGWPHATC